jgi:hypothetical protein
LEKSNVYLAFSCIADHAIQLISKDSPTVMKKFILLTAAIIISILCYSQKASSLSDFLNQDIKQIMQNRIDSLSYQLDDANYDLEAKKDEVDDLNRQVSQTIHFLLLLHKLENNLPLSKEDSTFASINNPPSPEHPYSIFMEEYAFDLITNNDSSFIDSYPKLKQWVAEKKLTFSLDVLGRASAPAIELPPPSATGANKQKIAAAWLKYIYDLSSECNVAKDQVDKYLKIERTKVPDNNLDKIIEVRRKFSFFIQENYCK